MTSTATAEPWLTAETPAALAMSDAQEGAFRPGVMPALGGYLSHGHFAVGVRARFGVLRNGPAPGNNMVDPGVGGLGTLGLAVRATLGRTWFEVVGGGGITGHDWVPAVEVGVGWMMPVGSFEVGPSARFMRVVSPSSMATFGDADLALIGVDVRFGRDRPRLPSFRAAVPAPVPPPAPDPVIPPSDDHDVAIDAETSCATDLDGCRLSADVFVIHDHIVLPERIMFDLNRARVRSRGREAIAHIADAWHTHPAWTHITIEGHADVRGSDAYNQWLSQARADHTRDELLKHGFWPDMIDAIGYGRTRPRDPGTDEAAHANNRRVEFVIVTETPNTKKGTP